MRDRLARVMPAPARPEHRALGGSAETQHQARAMNDVVRRKRQGQRGQTVGAQCKGDEERIRENIAGKADHAQHVQADIFGKVGQQAVFHGFSSFRKEKAPGAFLPRPAGMRSGARLPYPVAGQRRYIWLPGEYNTIPGGGQEESLNCRKEPDFPLEHRMASCYNRVVDTVESRDGFFTPCLRPGKDGYRNGAGHE